MDTAGGACGAGAAVAGVAQGAHGAGAAGGGGLGDRLTVQAEARAARTKETAAEGVRAQTKAATMLVEVCTAPAREVNELETEQSAKDAGRLAEQE